MFEQDYMMRMIHEMVRMLIKLLSGKDTERYDQIEFKEEETRADYERLVRLADSGDICGAENELVENADVGNQDDLRKAVLFYSHLSGMSDEFLAEHNFSREEIAQGLRYMADMYGYGEIMGLLEE
ncbi:MAG: hypothetical protein HDT13_05305 [Butyrivibrio sp.]|nr:hypothetical protein [Butyrivibrio sp.]